MKQYILPFLIFTLIAAPKAHAQNPAEGPPPTLKIYRPVGDFSFQDETGAEFNRENMLGTVWVAQFFLINCTGPCPVVTTRLGNTLRKLRGELKVQALSITVDPEHDTPERIAAYKEIIKPEAERWHFVRGDRETLRSVLTKSFHVPDSNSLQAHTTNLVLIDPRGQIRGYYSGIRAEDFGKLDKDIYTLLHERVSEPASEADTKSAPETQNE